MATTGSTAILDGDGKPTTAAKALSAAMHARQLTPIWVRRPSHRTLLDVKVDLAGAARTFGLPLQTAVVDADTLAIWITERPGQQDVVRRAMDIPPSL